MDGRANGRLVAEVVGRIPGMALDAGCVEGTDAIWLARRGWTVTAATSPMSPWAGREAAERAAVAVEWVCGEMRRDKPA